MPAPLHRQDTGAMQHGSRAVARKLEPLTETTPPASISTFNGSVAIKPDGDDL